MRRILLTGVAGFIGSNLTIKLLKEGHVITGLDNFDNFYDRRIKEENISSFITDQNFNLIEDDIRNHDRLSNIFKEQKIDLIIHLAAKAGVRPSLTDPAEYFDVNVNGTINLLELMKENGVKDMLFASSSSVYGNNKKLPFSETDNVDFPISPYAASKKSGELVTYTYHSLYDFNIFALRFFTVYGPRQRPEMAIAKFADLILNNIPIQLYDGDGSTSRDYTYIDDIVGGIVKCIDNLNGYEILNLGESQTVKLIELVRLIEKNLNKKAEIIFEGKKPGDVEHTYADISKAKQLISYNPSTKIEDGIKKYCDWFISRKNSKI